MLPGLKVPLIAEVQDGVRHALEGLLLLFHAGRFLGCLWALMLYPHSEMTAVSELFLNITMCESLCCILPHPVLESGRRVLFTLSWDDQVMWQPCWPEALCEPLLVIQGHRAPIWTIVNFYFFAALWSFGVPLFTFPDRVIMAIVFTDTAINLLIIGVMALWAAFELGRAYSETVTVTSSSSSPSTSAAQGLEADEEAEVKTVTTVTAELDMRRRDPIVVEKSGE